MKSNTVEYESVGHVDGVSVKVKAVASATASTYEEAWLLAQAAAKSDADLKLGNVLKKIENNGSVTEIVIKGDPGPQGPPGPPGALGYQGNRGPRGQAGSDGKDLKNIVNNITTKLTLASEVVSVLNSIKNKEEPTDPCENISLSSIKDLFTPITDILESDASVDAFDSTESKTDLSLSGDGLTNLKAAFASVFSNENKNKLLCLAKKNGISVQVEPQDNINIRDDSSEQSEVVSFVLVVVGSTILFNYDEDNN